MKKVITIPTSDFQEVTYEMNVFIDPNGLSHKVMLKGEDLCLTVYTPTVKLEQVVIDMELEARMLHSKIDVHALLKDLGFE